MGILIFYYGNLEVFLRIKRVSICKVFRLVLDTKYRIISISCCYSHSVTLLFICSFTEHPQWTWPWVAFCGHSCEHDSGPALRSSLTSWCRSHTCSTLFPLLHLQLQLLKKSVHHLLLLQSCLSRHCLPRTRQPSFMAFENALGFEGCCLGFAGTLASPWALVSLPDTREIRLAAFQGSSQCFPTSRPLSCIVH